MVFKINKVAKNLLSIGLSSLISQILTFFMIAYYARVLSIEGFGKINLAQSILVYFTMITLFGFQTLGTKEVSKCEKNSEKLVGNVVFFRILIAIVCFLVIVLISFIVNKGSTFKTILIIYGLTLFPMSFNIDWFYSGIQKMQHNAAFNIIKNGIPFLLVFIFFKSENQIYFIPIFTLCGLILAVIYHMFIFTNKMGLKFSLGISKKEIKKYIPLSVPFLVSGILSMINCNLDSIIIGFARSEYELGIYSSAYKIIFFLINLIAVIFTPFFPLLISYYHEKDRINLENTVKSLCKIVILVGVPITFGGVLLSKEIIILLFGQKYVGAYVPFIILLFYILLLFMRETYGYSLNAWNMEGKYLKSVVISAFLNLVLNIILIPKYGIVAAAGTTLVSEIVNFFIMMRYATRVVKTNYIKNFIKILIPLIIMITSVMIFKYFKVHLIINIGFAIIVYFSSVIYFKYISLDELRKFLRK